MGPISCMEQEIDALYLKIKNDGLNPLDLFKKRTLRILSRVVERGAHIWEEEDSHNYRIFRRMLGRAIDRKVDHDRYCPGADDCLDKRTDLYYKDVTRAGYSPLDLFQPKTLLILERVTRRYRDIWKDDDQRSFKIFRDMLWDALERWAEHNSFCDDNDELRNTLDELRDRIQRGA